MDVSDEVAVIDPPVIVPPVSVVKKEVMPCMIVAMRPVEVVVPVTVAFVAKRFPVVTFEVEALPSTVCPDTVSAVAEALPRDDVPEMRVENVPVVKDGLRVVAMVLVLVKMMLDPAMRFDTGLL